MLSNTFIYLNFIVNCSAWYKLYVIGKNIKVFEFPVNKENICQKFIYINKSYSHNIKIFKYI